MIFQSISFRCFSLESNSSTNKYLVILLAVLILMQAVQSFFLACTPKTTEPPISCGSMECHSKIRFQFGSAMHRIRPFWQINLYYVRRCEFFKRWIAQKGLDPIYLLYIIVNVKIHLFSYVKKEND